MGDWVSSVLTRDGGVLAFVGVFHISNKPNPSFLAAHILNVKPTAVPRHGL